MLKTKKILEITKMNIMENEQGNLSLDKRILDQEYWDTQYISNTTGWDLGEVSPPIKSYIDTIEDKNISILIPAVATTMKQSIS